MANVKNILVIGLGRFGSSIARTLTEMGPEVMGVDNCEEHVNDLAGILTHVVQMDATDERAIAQLGVRNFDVVVVGVANDLRASILATVLCKEYGAKKVICKASDELHAKLLLKTGADKAIRPEWDSGVRLAHSLVSENVLDFLELSKEYGISEITLPASWANKTLRDINVRANYGVSIIALRRNGKIHMVLNAEMVFVNGDVLVLIGANRDLKRVENLPSC